VIEPTFDLDLEDLNRAFSETSRRARNLTSVWRQSAPELKADIRETGRKRQGPDGAWEPLAPATQAKRRQQRQSPGGKKWRRKLARATLGQLRMQFDIEWGPKFIRAISRIPWSGVHQEGGIVGRGAKIPARVHMWASEKFLGELVERVLDHVTRRF
jgi:phage gpG-like protein